MSDMKNRKVSASKRRARQRKQRNRRIAMTLCLMLVVCVASIGGTLAWLTSTTAPVVNTFTPSDINITLSETWNTDSDGNGVNDSWTAKMVPGNTITKDPKVTVEANSEACWLFVEVVKSDNFDSFMTYTMANGWIALDGVDNVYYREVSASASDQEFAILSGNTVSVMNTVTKANMNALTSDTYPTLTFTAYAVQKDNVSTATDAWSKRSTT